MRGAAAATPLGHSVRLDWPTPLHAILHFFATRCFVVQLHILTVCPFIFACCFGVHSLLPSPFANPTPNCPAWGTINPDARLLTSQTTMCADADKTVAVNNDHLVQSDDPEHPANLIPALCRNFYNWGWVTGTGGGVSDKTLRGIAPSAR